MRPEASYQLPLAYIFNKCRSLTSPFSEAGLHPPKPPTSLIADDRHVVSAKKSRLHSKPEEHSPDPRPT